MRVLVTGGAGFIGSNLSEYMNVHNATIDIVVLDDLSSGRLSNLEGLNLEFQRGSILDVDALHKAMEGVDAVVHLAAIGSVPRSIASPKPSHDANATGTLNVLEAAKSAQVEQVIVASSSSVYGSNAKLPKSEDDWTAPMSPYAVSKLATEGYALAYGRSYGMSTLAFRFFNVYGPKQAADHDYAAVIPKFIDAAHKGIPLTIHGDGRQSRDFTFVETVCATIYDALIRRVSFERPINLAFGSNVSLLELVELLETNWGSPLQRAHSEVRRGDVRASQADGTLVRRLFPTIDPIPLETGLRKTISWFSTLAGRR